MVPTPRHRRLGRPETDTGLPTNERLASEPARNWIPILNQYREPSRLRSIIELIITALPLVALWVLMWLVLRCSYWLALPLALPAAAFLVRLFMIQHDCGHGSFFHHRLANDWVGRVIGVLTLTPYDFWRQSHAVHHATSGNLDRRGIGDIDTLTVREYRALNKWGRLRYRLYRHPAVMFCVGPAYLFLLQHRLPVGFMRGGWTPWLSTMLTNLAIAAIAATLIWFIGFKALLLVHLPIVLIAASIGVWLFYVQHQFEHTVWQSHQCWDMREAALHGSSHYDLPPVLRWFTANIGVHHVHHLCSRIPSYRLMRVMRDHPALTSVGRLTLLDSIRCARLALWDEGRAQLVPFRALQTMPAVSQEFNSTERGLFAATSSDNVKAHGLGCADSPDNPMVRARRHLPPGSARGPSMTRCATKGRTDHAKAIAGKDVQ
jgi:omega-6 fatty acid desaturase (delta-12 desaturase)